MATIKIVGKTRIKKIKEDIKAVYQIKIEVFDKDGNIADDQATLSEIRSNTPKSSIFSIHTDARIERFEKMFETNFGTRISVLQPNGSEVDKNDTIKDVQALYRQLNGDGVRADMGSEDSPTDLTSAFASVLDLETDDELADILMNGFSDSEQKEEDDDD